MIGRVRVRVRARAMAGLAGLATAALLLLCAPAARSHEYYALGFKLIHPWAEASAPAATEAAVYFKLEHVLAPDRLLRASTPYAEAVELREMVGQTNQSVAVIDIAPADSLEFSAAGQHLLLRGLKVPLEWGRSYLMTMVFERAGPILVMVSVGAH